MRLICSYDIQIQERENLPFAMYMRCNMRKHAFPCVWPRRIHNTFYKIGPVASEEKQFKELDDGRCISDKLDDNKTLGELKLGL